MTSGSQFSPTSDYYTTCNREQGLSVGWGDLYPNGTSGQYIDVTSVADGTYCFRTTADPLNKIRETSNTNNVNSRWITLETSGSGSRTVSAGSLGCAAGGGNTAPTANAGADQSVATGSTVNLDSSGSIDPEGDSLSYSWTFVAKPAGSSASLAGANTASPSFVADVDGTYEVKLIVNDGSVGDEDTVVVTASTPVAATIMHVDDLDAVVSLKGKSGRWEVFVTVKIQDNSNDPVSNATVSGTWTGAASANVSGVSGGDGIVTFRTGTMPGGATVTFTVADVTHSSLGYDPSVNDDPETDSDGNSITVSKP
jgi:hypothetical protein